MKRDTVTNIPLLLRYFFKWKGHVRWPNPKRRRQDGQKYKKGYEIRLVVKTREELRQMRQQLRRAGFKLGKPFKKAKQIVQPIYGKQAVERFLSWI